MEALGLLAVVGGLVLLPLLAVKMLLGLLLLPLKLIAALLKALVGVAGALLGVAFGGIGLLVGLLARVTVFVVLPLLPFLLVGGLVVLAVKALRPRAVRVA